MGEKRFNRPYGLWSLRADVEEIKERLMQLTNNLTPELYTLKNHREANEICQKIHEYIQDGHKVEIIMRKV
ncbi:MAG TPA: hypothetical protein VMY59_07070 [Candidatus Thermoplasmatota archaeon]|nr:hypothetical protein [Candidatus Thermoplasmatota archaeon]